MKIENVHISNWRSIKSLDMDFQDLMIFIGQNNHGKSNILSALLFFFGEIKFQDQDLNHNANEMHVEITFSDLDVNDESTFKKYLTSNKKIKVRKSAFRGGSFEYKGYTQMPKDIWLREANSSDYTKREVAETLPFYQTLPSSGKITKQQVIDAQITYMQQNANNIEYEYMLEDTNFLGLKSVAKGIFGDIYFIPAIKDPSEDFASKESSVFGVLYSGIIESISKGDPEWAETKNKLSLLFGAMNRQTADGKVNSKRPQELKDFEEALGKELITWGAKIDVEVTPPNIDDVFRANAQVWVNDGARTDIRRKGHGLQRALTFALIKVFSLHLRASRLQEAPTGRSVSASTFFILEEPELYLHPQAQRALFESLVELSSSKNQVLLCTHSSSLIDVEKYKSICIVKKEDETLGTKICQCTEELFSGDRKKDFNLSYWINPDRSELFFASRVILVEGPTDKIILPLLARKIGVFRHDYTLVDCGSKDNIPLYCLLLNKFKIPYIAVYDKDYQSHKGADARASADRSSALVEAAIDHSIGKSVIFFNDIEEELGMTAGDKNKPYVALTQISQSDYTILPQLEAKVREIYQ